MGAFQQSLLFFFRQGFQRVFQAGGGLAVFTAPQRLQGNDFAAFGIFGAPFSLRFMLCHTAKHITGNPRIEGAALGTKDIGIIHSGGLLSLFSLRELYHGFYLDTRKKDLLVLDGRGERGYDEGSLGKKVCKNEKNC